MTDIDHLELDNDKFFVNGPINVARLTGKVGDKQKIIYLFFDFHMSVLHQTQCPSYMSEDFVRYFVKTIKTTNKKKQFDFFFEVGPTFSDRSLPQFRGRYIDEVYRYFKTSINVVRDEKTKKSINKGSKYTSNLRLHYIDIRDYLKTNINIINNEIHNLLNSMLCEQYVRIDIVENVDSLLTKLQDEINRTTSKLSSKKISKDTKTDFIENIFEKLFNRYSDDNVKDKLLNESHIVKLIKQLLENIYEHIKELRITINDIRTNYVPANVLTKGHFNEFNYGTDHKTHIETASKLVTTFYDIDYEILCMYAYIIDVYFMRRFLDKSYINNGILYAGAMHCANCLHILVKQFGFEITHVSYADCDIDTLHRIIKENEFSNEFSKHFMRPTFSQCVDMTHFPKKFE